MDNSKGKSSGDSVVAGNAYDKYGTPNPIARFLMRRFLRAFDRLVQHSGATSVTEHGCGEGHLARRMALRGLQVIGTDISPEIIAEARQHAAEAGLAIPFHELDLLQDDLSPYKSDLIVCCEVLEHVSSPELVLEKLAALGSHHVLLSVPREPLWRVLNIIRLRYLSTLGNTPGHLQHWSKPAFVKLVSTYADVVEVSSPLPWTMILARPRRSPENLGNYSTSMRSIESASA